MRGWNVQDALELYNLSAWGGDFFTVNIDGTLSLLLQQY